MDDLISRQAAINAISEWGLIDGLSEGQAIEILGDEEKVPSVQPNLQQTCNQLATDCISRQAAADAVQGIGRLATLPDNDAVIRMSAVEYVLFNLPSAQPEPQWIPCSERLPEDENRSYWVCTDNGYQHECRWTNINPVWTNLTTDWHWNIFDIPQYSKVIAWMPLPEPYKGES